MKKIIFLFTFILISNYIYSQCQDFTFKVIDNKLGDYIPNGKYHSLKLREGEEILIFKTISQGLSYRFVVMSEENIPQPHFTITDWDNKIIYNNVSDKATYFDFTPGKTQRIKIIIKVPKSSKKTNIKEGCVALVIGISNNL